MREYEERSKAFARLVVDDPVVKVAPYFPGSSSYADDEPDAFVLDCSSCGRLYDVGDGVPRATLQRRAAEHAEQAHDGLVVAEGWAR